MHVFLKTSISGDFTISTRVSCVFAGNGDAACLLVWYNNQHWLKLGFGRISSGDNSIVTVVTNKTSDGAHGEVIRTSDCYLRISRKANEFAMHHSQNGDKWRLARYFLLEGLPNEVQAGICAQSPMCDGSLMEFWNLNISYEALRNFPISD